MCTGLKRGNKQKKTGRCERDKDRKIEKRGSEEAKYKM